MLDYAKQELEKNVNRKKKTFFHWNVQFPWGKT